MPVMFFMGIGSLLVDIVAAICGAPIPALGSMVFWSLAMYVLGNGMDYSRRMMAGLAYAAISAASALAVVAAVTAYRLHVP